MSNIKASEKPAKKRVVKKTAAAKSAPKKKTKTAATKRKTNPTKKSASSISEDQRLQMIREAAYFRAEQRGFAGGNAEQDWLEAEAEVNQRIGA